MKSTTTFTAVALHPSLPQGRSLCTFEVSQNSIILTVENEIFQLPLEETTLRTGGTNQSLVYIAHPLYQEWTFYTRDIAWLDALPAHAPHEMHQQVKRIRKVRGRKKPQALLTLALIAVSCILLWNLTKATASHLAGFVPYSVEKWIGDKIFALGFDQNKIIRHDPLNAAIARYTAPLVEAYGRNDITIYVYEDETPNALALPGGTILVHSSLLHLTNTPEELLGIIAHEIAHIDRQHSLRRIISSIGITAFATYVLGDIMGLGVGTYELSNTLLTQSYSREQEEEADRLGFAHLIKGNINPRGMITVFQSMEAYQEKQALVTGATLLQSHPALASRVESLQQELAKRPAGHYRSFAGRYLGGWQ